MTLAPFRVGKRDALAKTFFLCGLLSPRNLTTVACVNHRHHWPNTCRRDRRKEITDVAVSAPNTGELGSHRANRSRPPYQEVY
jgi:hypothetical protein